MAAHDSGEPTPNALPNLGTGRARVGKGPLRERFEAIKNTAIDDAMAKGDSWAKKVESGDSGVKLDDIPKLINVLGLKLVDVSRICITPEQVQEYEAYRVIAARHLAPAPKLDPDWDKPG